MGWNRPSGGMNIPYPKFDHMTISIPTVFTFWQPQIRQLEV